MIWFQERSSRGRLLRASAPTLALMLSLLFSLSAAFANPPSSFQSENELSKLTIRQRAIEKQRTRLASTDIEERRDAVTILGSMRHADASRAAVPALTDAAPIVRVTAARAVLSLSASEAVSVLLPLLSDKKEFVRQEAAYALGETRSRAAIAGLIALLEGDKIPSVRSAAAVSLGLIADDSAAPMLISKIDPSFGASQVSNTKNRNKREQNRFVQRAAVRSLGQMKSRLAVPVLISALSNKQVSEDLRREIVLALKRIGDKAAIPVFREALTSNDPYLAQIAYEALRELNVSNPGAK